MALTRKNKVEPQFSLAAMIDVIFLLLMFFMLTSKFVTPNALNLQLPSSASAPTESDDPALTVSIDGSGNFKLNNRRTNKENLMSAVESRMKGLGKDPSETTIAVVTEANTPIEDVVFILDIANKLAVKTILATDME